MLVEANLLQEDVCFGSVTDLLTDKIIDCKNIRFMEEQSFQLLVPPVSLTAAVATSDTTISFVTANYASS